MCLELSDWTFSAWGCLCLTRYSKSHLDLLKTLHQHQPTLRGIPVVFSNCRTIAKISASLSWCTRIWGVCFRANMANLSIKLSYFDFFWTKKTEYLLKFNIIGLTNYSLGLNFSSANLEHSGIGNSTPECPVLVYWGVWHASNNTGKSGSCL